MSEYKVIAGKTYADAGIFPEKFAKEYAQKHRAEGWWIRLEKLSPPYPTKVIKGKRTKLTHRVWLGGSNRPRRGIR